tara:strand:+ start:50 stop:595 length:546 start_codon:yes stop_codon:yes gene_type:complete
MNTDDLNNNFKKMDINTPPKKTYSDSSTQGHTTSDSDDNIKSPNNSIASEASTILDSPGNYNNENNNNLINDLYEQIYSLKKEINVLKQDIKSYEFNYKDVPIPSTEIIDNRGNNIFTLCPLTTAHSNDAILFTEDGKLIKAKKLFSDLKEETKSKSPATKKRKRGGSKSKGGKKSRKNCV